MEPAEAWGPCQQFQLANWTVEEPAAGFPTEYASMDIFDTYSLQTYVPADGSSGGQQQLVSDDRLTNGVFKHVASEFDKADIEVMEKKMHRYPPCLKSVDTCHTVPRFVAIGPYHHNREALEPAEKVKHVAARYCITKGHTVEEVYVKNVMAGISYVDFRHIMFFDACCFLVQFMILRCGTTRYKRIQENDDDDDDGSWKDFLQEPDPVECGRGCLELHARMSSVSKDFVRKMRHLLLPDRQDDVGHEKPFLFDENYTPAPHLLGLLRHHIVGTSQKIYTGKHDSKAKTISFSVCAIELAEIGITVTASKSTKLTAMSLNTDGYLL
uniref:Uncharacterized protein n=1 Tax=Setaria viridis TaxID=4556 RepID=A0A4U6VMP4_SETVI|nr:hypothetical protein SEVIR_3G405200v2 [Setaria viridis]